MFGLGINFPALPTEALMKLTVCISVSVLFWKLIRGCWFSRLHNSPVKWRGSSQREQLETPMGWQLGLSSLGPAWVLGLAAASPGCPPCAGFSAGQTRASVSASAPPVPQAVHKAGWCWRKLFAWPCHPGALRSGPLLPLQPWAVTEQQLSGT